MHLDLYVSGDVAPQVVEVPRPSSSVDLANLPIINLYRLDAGNVSAFQNKKKSTCTARIPAARGLFPSAG